MSPGADAKVARDSVEANSCPGRCMIGNRFRITQVEDNQTTNSNAVWALQQSRKNSKAEHRLVRINPEPPETTGRKW